MQNYIENKLKSYNKTTSKTIYSLKKYDARQIILHCDFISNKLESS